MQNCETCRHWEKATGTERWQAFGTCRGIPFVENVVSGGLIASMRARLAAGTSEQEAVYLKDRRRKLCSLEEQRAFTEGEDDREADLRTRADFGCVNHSPRD